MTAVRVQVTQQDIDAGCHDGSNCPCARAARRVLPGFPRIRFGIRAWWLDDRTGPALPYPAEVADWIDRYDYRKPVEPFEFDLDVPDDLLAGAS